MTAIMLLPECPETWIPVKSIQGVIMIKRNHNFEKIEK